MNETLLSAARRAVRFFNIDNTSGGGLISRETCGAMETLDRMWRVAAEREKAPPAAHVHEVLP